jgi:phage-related protein
MHVFYYKSALGRRPVQEFVESLSIELRDQTVEALGKLEAGEQLKMPLSRPLFGIYRGLHELRLRDRTGSYRILYFIAGGGDVFLLHGFKKKTEVLPLREIRLVLRRLREVL